MKYLLPGVLMLMCASAIAQPIHLHPDNPHYLKYRGEPIVLVTSAEHYGAVINLDFDYEVYLQALSDEGMNYTRIFAGSYVENDQSFGIEHNTLAPSRGRLIVPWARSDIPGYVNGGNRFDLDTWDPAYFERLRGFVHRAEALGIIVEVTPFSSTYTDENWRYSPLHPENNINGTDAINRQWVHTLNNGNLLGHQERLVRKLVRELQDFDNIFYEVQNEPWSDQTVPAMHINPRDPDSAERWYRRADLASEASLEWQRQIVTYIVEEEASFEHKHLIAQNYCNFRYPLPEVDPRVSMLNFHYAFPEAVTWNYGYDRVINFDESGFAGAEPGPYRKQAWAFMLAGGGAFNGLDYSFTAEHEDGKHSEWTSPGGGGVDLRRQLRVLREFIEGFDFVRMKPRPDVLRLAPNAVVYVLADEGAAYAVYVDGALTGSLELYMPSGAYDVSWIDTDNGAVIQEGTVSVRGGTGSFAAPDYEEDVALRITSRD